MNRILDVHHHVFPQGTTHHQWDIVKDHNDMEEAGISHVLLSCPVPLLSKQVREVNELLAESARKYPDMYYPLASVAFDDIDQALEEIAYASDILHMKGFILSSNNHSIYISDDSLDPLFDELNRRKSVVFLHPSPKRAKGYDVYLEGADDSAYEYTFETTRSMMDYIYKDKMLRNPDIRWVLAHAGGTIPFLGHRVSFASTWHAARQEPELIEKQIQSLYYDLALSNDQKIYRFLKDFCGTSHILFGSDCPAHKVPDIVESIRDLEDSDVFDEDEKDKIAYSNSAELFNIKI